MAENVVWWRLKYPERAYAYVGPFLFGKEVADMDPKYYPAMIHAVERCIFTDDYFTERERDVFKKYVMENMSIVCDQSISRFCPIKYWISNPASIR